MLIDRVCWTTGNPRLKQKLRACTRAWMHESIHESAWKWTLHQYSMKDSASKSGISGAYCRLDKIEPSDM